MVIGISSKEGLCSVCVGSIDALQLRKRSFAEYDEEAEEVGPEKDYFHLILTLHSSQEIYLEFDSWAEGLHEYNKLTSLRRC
jgi:hypothetical protein